MLNYKLVRRQFREQRYPMVVFSQPSAVWSDFRTRWRSFYRANYAFIWCGVGIALGAVIGKLFP